MKCTIGIDFGTNSVRALVVNCATGDEVGSCVATYPSGRQGILLDGAEPTLARQHPPDYLSGMAQAVRGALRAGPFRIVGIGVESTGSSPLPVDERNLPLACHERWRDHLAAQCWLWKDHTSWWEAAEITRLAARHRPHYIARCGNTYSSEWWWAKIWHCARVAPDVFDAAASWVELCDWIPSVLCGVEDPRRIRRGICAAGHKALFCDEWGGLPDKVFLSLLDPRLADLRDRLYDAAHDASASAGTLCPEWAARLGLPIGIPIAVGAFDVHYGAIACGVQEGTLVKAIGTSTCDCAVVSGDVADIPGICGIVRGSILPGMFGVEAGQSAVGDIFRWFVETLGDGDHGALIAEVAAQAPGQSGLLALDWHNGNRTILVDPLLTGLLVGQTLHTTRAEIYRALIEATAFGARTIIERLEAYGVRIDRIVCCGGIAEKNPFLMQVYADVTGRRMRVSGSAQACALGGAVVASVVAGVHPTFAEAQSRMTSLKAQAYEPRPEHRAAYDELYRIYRQLHDAFGGVNRNADLSSVMKSLLALRERPRVGALA